MNRVLQEAELKPENQQKPNNLTTLNLRSNRLKGNIILGNYGVSEAAQCGITQPSSRWCCRT